MSVWNKQMNKLTLVIENEEHLVALRNHVKNLATSIRMNLINQTKLMTAASELARNMLRYGGGGQVSMAVQENQGRKGIRIVFTDQGPGIDSLEEAMRDGFSTGKGLGLGLPGTKRLMDEFHIETHLQQGTQVTITQWQR